MLRYNEFKTEKEKKYALNLWLNEAIESLTSYFGNPRDWNRLRATLRPVIKMALETESWGSFNDFLGNHTKYWKRNPNGGLLNLFFPTLEYLFHDTMEISKDEFEEDFAIEVIDYLDLALRNDSKH